jgi:hypothetical protein
MAVQIISDEILVEGYGSVFNTHADPRRHLNPEQYSACAKILRCKRKQTAEIKVKAHL